MFKDKTEANFEFLTNIRNRKPIQISVNWRSCYDTNGKRPFSTNRKHINFAISDKFTFTNNCHKLS